MAITTPKVQPGDVITAQFVNGLIDALTDLDTRLQKLEGTTTGPLQILSPLPTDQYRVGDELRIFGSGFGVPTLNTVTVDDTKIVTTFKAGSSERLLIIDIPAIAVPDAGRKVNLSVTNSRGFASTSFLLLPAVATLPTGSISVSRTGPSPTVAAPGIDLSFQAFANATLDETYTVSVQLANAPGWDAFLADQSGNRVVPSEVFVPRTGSATFKIHVSVPNGASGTATLTVILTSKRNAQLTQTTGGIPLPVGSAPPPPDKIDLQFSMVFAGTGQLVSGEIHVPADVETEVDYTALLPALADYNVAPPQFTPNDNNLWSARLITPKFTQKTGQATVKIGVTPKSGATASNISVHIESATDSTVAGNRILPIKIG
jgi:hypothetical protein